MTNCVKETLCTSCVHREVCSKKEEYLAAQKAVDNLFVKKNDVIGNYLNTMTWIKPVQLQCIYHMSNCYSTVRGITVTDCTGSTSDNVFSHIVGGDTIAR